MAVYQVTNTGSPLAFVEFTPVSDGNLTFFTLKNPERKEEVKQWLASTGQRIAGEALIHGKPILVTCGDKTSEELTALVEATSGKLKLYEAPIPFSEKAWQIGATMAITGQFMQLASGFLRPSRKVDWSLVGLAVPNLIGNAWILLCGAQRSEDTHRLAYLKNHFNEKLGEYVPGGADALPGIDENSALLQRDPPQPPAFGDKFKSFMRRHSVDVGEIGLRYAGALSLAFKFDNWSKACQKLASEGVGAAYNAARTVTPNASSLTGPNLTHYAGLLSLAGKTVALTARAPDPYDPKPKSWLETMREKYTFRLGGMMETMAFAAIAADGFINKKISLKKGGKPMMDLLSGIGGTLFTIRYIIRFWAPFGVKETNMDEMYAHVTASLAKIPANKLPQLLAESAAEITDHFKEKRLHYSEVYLRLMTDLYEFHHISLDNFGDNSVPAPEKLPEKRQPVQAWPALAPRSLADRAAAPAGNYTDALHAVALETPLGMGA